MTLIIALEMLKAKGITKLTGMYNVTDINKYLENAHDMHNTSVKYSDVPCHQYSLDHEDDHFIVETNGHYIIAKHYDNFDMAVYGDYDTDEQMQSDFNNWKIAQEAEAIATEMDNTRPNELPHTAWVLIAISELKAAYQASKIAFEREFSNQ